MSNDGSITKQALHDMYVSAARWKLTNTWKID